MQARRAELLALRGGSAGEALRLAEETIGRIHGADVPPAVQALLERIRGAGYAQRADLERARQALRRALEIAEEANVDYEAGLALRALATLDGGIPDASATAIFARLGVDEAALPRP
jgi:hypothetical protein